ncbi:MAG: Mut7-C RNAse domain-containing protein [Chthoniobacterales bacterium]
MAPGGEGSAFTVTLHFDRDLSFFLPRRSATAMVTRVLSEKTSVKDIIESCGVPHTEIGAITVKGVNVDFAHQLSSDGEVFVRGLQDPDTPNEQSLQRTGLTRFVADGHLGKLARDLRLLGFDVVYAPHADDPTLVRISADEERALLTRDRRLLMHRAVRDGYCVRSTDPDEQIVEVLQRFAIEAMIAPYTRCIACNGSLKVVAKGDIIDQLEPLTRIHYEEFRRCSECGKIYWSGSHFGKLEARLAVIRAAIAR